MKSFTDKIIMVRPAAFGFNPQTAASNAFQVRVDLSAEEVQKKALREFDRMTEDLEKNGIEILICADAAEPHTPDAVFPNNWFSTHAGGTICLYPMEAEARRFERHSEMLAKVREKFVVEEIFDLTDFEKERKFLEGTGSLVLDRAHKIAYAGISSRTSAEALTRWQEFFGFEVVKFESFDRSGKAVYHTNVLMCLGEDFAVACLESIARENEKRLFCEKLHQTGKEIIEISFEQMNDFAGNMLFLLNKNQEKILVASRTAVAALSALQIERLEARARILSFDIETIEKCGGGSVRCMIAENFLTPR